MSHDSPGCLALVAELREWTRALLLTGGVKRASARDIGVREPPGLMSANAQPVPMPIIQGGGRRAAAWSARCACGWSVKRGNRRTIERAALEHWEAEHGSTGHEHPGAA